MVAYVIFKQFVESHNSHASAGIPSCCFTVASMWFGSAVDNAWIGVPLGRRIWSKPSLPNAGQNASSPWCGSPAVLILWASLTWTRPILWTNAWFSRRSWARHGRWPLYDPSCSRDTIRCWNVPSQILCPGDQTIAWLVYIDGTLNLPSRELHHSVCPHWSQLFRPQISHSRAPRS